MGLVDRSLVLDLAALRTMPTHAVRVTMELPAASQVRASVRRRTADGGPDQPLSNHRRGTVGGRSVGVLRLRRQVDVVPAIVAGIACDVHEFKSPPSLPVHVLVYRPRY